MSRDIVNQICQIRNLGLSSPTIKPQVNHETGSEAPALPFLCSCHCLAGPRARDPFTLFPSPSNMEGNTPGLGGEEKEPRHVTQGPLNSGRGQPASAPWCPGLGTCCPHMLYCISVRERITYCTRPPPRQQETVPAYRCRR